MCVYNLHARIQLVYMDMYQASFCGFLIITSMGGFLLHQRIVCSLHECVCVSVCVSLCVRLCVCLCVCTVSKDSMTIVYINVCVCLVCVCSKCPCGYFHITIGGATLLCVHTHTGFNEGSLHTLYFL